MRKRVHCTMLFVYLLISVLFLFGIYLGTFVQPDEMTVSYLVLLFAVPLLFTDRPLRMILVIFFSIILYFIAAKITQSAQQLAYNATSVIPYGILSMITSSYMMKIKVERFYLAQENRFLSESDQLTGLLNRRSYEQHMQKIRQLPGSSCLTYCAFDVNGLKTVNDTLGHHAGDELIKGAADCLQAVFGNYGVCYRTGGDEFIAILKSPSPSPDELIKMLCAQTQAWKGAIVAGLSISAGIVSGNEGMTPDEVVQLADKQMYKYKAEYYSRNGFDRRGKQL